MRANYKKTAIILGLSVILIGWGGTIFAKKINNNVSINAQAQENKKEEEKIVNYVGTNEEGKKYTYDAKKVADKLAKYDYSNDGKKVVFLTFDDGTSKTNTPEILRILDENNVKATFFLTGSNIENGGEKAKELIKEEFDKGHAIANHGYSHDCKKLYPNRSLDLEAFKADLDKNDELLTDVLGKYFSTRVIRCPGGHGSWKNMEPLDNYLEETLTLINKPYIQCSCCDGLGVILE